MPNLRPLLFFLCTLLFTNAHAQSGLSGAVNTKDGKPLPFAAIVVKGTSIGTMSNAEGKYQLDLKPGYYEIVFQYLGFKTTQKQLTLEAKPQVMDVTLDEQALNLGEVRVGAQDEDPAYTIMRSAIAKSRFHLLQVDGYTAKAYSKSSFVITDLPLEFLYKDQLKELDKNGEFKKGVPILNETVTEVVFSQPNSYKQRVVATRNSQGSAFANPNAYFLASFYRPEVGGGVSPLSPKAFGYYKFVYEGSFVENGVEVNKIKVIPRAFGEGVFRGSIYIIENVWSIHSLKLQTVNQGITFEIKQVFSPLQGVWMPINQQYHIEGGLYGVKGKADFVVSQRFTSLKVNPAFREDIVVIDEKKYRQEAKRAAISKQDLKTQNLEQLVAKQKEFSSKDLRKLMKEYEKQEKKQKKEKGEDIDAGTARNDSVKIDSLANRRSMAFWDSLRTVPLTKAEVKSYVRMDSLKIMKDGTKMQRDSLKKANGDTLKKSSVVGKTIGGVLMGHSFRLGKKSNWSLNYASPISDVQINTVEGYVLNGGIKLKYDKTDTNKITRKTNVRSFSAGGAARYSSAREKILGTGLVDYSWRNHRLSLRGGQTVSQINANNPIGAGLNSITTVFFERNFMKLYEKQFARMDFNTNQRNGHFEFKTSLEYAQRQELSNAENLDRYRVINFKNVEYTPNAPFNQEVFDATGMAQARIPGHKALTFEAAASWKPWQRYRLRNGQKIYYSDDSPQISVQYRKGISGVLDSEVDYDFGSVSFAHGFDTGVRSSLRYQVGVGGFLNHNKVFFPDFKHFAGNAFFLQQGDPLTTFRALDYYSLSTSKQYAEAHLMAEFRKLLLTQLTWFRFMGIKENLFVHHLSTAASQRYTELGYGLDIGIRVPFRAEIVGVFQNQRYQQTVFRVGTTLKLKFN